METIITFALFGVAYGLLGYLGNVRTEKLDGAKLLWSVGIGAALGVLAQLSGAEVKALEALKEKPWHEVLLSIIGGAGSVYSLDRVARLMGIR